VDGGLEAAKRVIVAMGALGAVRLDFDVTYALSLQLGSGSNATVYAVRRPRRAVSVEEPLGLAVKIPNDNAHAGNGQLPSNWQEEIKMLTLCQGHGNVMRLRGIFFGHIAQAAGSETCKNPRWALLTDRYGMDLFDKVLARKGLSERHAQKIMKSILKGLAHVHGAGIIHRDVKPENVLLRGDGKVVLADFGIACRELDGRSQQQCGSPGYMAPEIIAGVPYDNAVDVFSAGALLYFVFAMQTPFDGKTLQEIVQKTSRGIVDFSAKPVFSFVSNESQNLILHLLSSSPRERPKADEAMHDCWFGLQHKTATKESSRKELLDCKDEAEQNRSEALEEVTSDPRVPTPKRRWPAILRNPVGDLLLNKHMPSLPLTQSTKASARAHSTSANIEQTHMQHAGAEHSSSFNLVDLGTPPCAFDRLSSGNSTDLGQPLCAFSTLSSGSPDPTMPPCTFGRLISAPCAFGRLSSGNNTGRSASNQTPVSEPFHSSRSMTPRFRRLCLPVSVPFGQPKSRLFSGIGTHRPA